MPPKKASARVSATSAPPKKKKTRKGRLVAYPTGIVPVELRPGFDPTSDNQTSQDKDTVSEPVSLEPVQHAQQTANSTAANTIDASSTITGPEPSVDRSRAQNQKSILATPPPDPTISTTDSELPSRKQLRSTRDTISMASRNVVSLLPTPESTSSPRTTTPSSQVESNVESVLSLTTATPADHAEMTSESSSDLSSAPGSIGSTPEGLLTRQARIASLKSQNISPTRRSGRLRKRNVKADDVEDSNNGTKRRKLTDASRVDVLPSIEESPEQLTSVESPSPNTTQTSSSADSSLPLTHKRKAVSLDDDDDDAVADEDCAKKIPAVSHKKGKKTKHVKKPVRKLSKAEQAEERQFYAELEKELAASNPRSTRRWPAFKRSKVIMYGADGQTQYTPAYAASAGSTGSATRGGKSNGRGGTRGGRGGAANNRGRHTRARGRGRDEDSPEPPLPKRTQPNDDALLIKYAKARQAELRKFFSIVGSQQAEILESLATRDLNRLAKKPKAHKQVPEFDEVTEHLERKRKETEDQIRKQYEIAIAAEELRLEGEKAAVANTLKVMFKLNIHDSPLTRHR